MFIFYTIQVKGKGEMETFWLRGHPEDRRAVIKQALSAAKLALDQVHPHPLSWKVPMCPRASRRPPSFMENPHNLLFFESSPPLPLWKDLKVLCHNLLLRYRPRRALGRVFQSQFSEGNGIRWRTVYPYQGQAIEGNFDPHNLLFFESEPTPTVKSSATLAPAIRTTPEWSRETDALSTTDLSSLT
jgi:hypothetical protein